MRVKQQVARAFGQAASSYDTAAGLQRQVGHHLLALLHRFSGDLHHKRILDVGAGSGYFSQLLHQAGAEPIALDLAEGMLQHIGRTQSTRCILADAEALPLQAASVDGAFSSLALQWCNLALAVAEMRRVCIPGGVMAISTLAQGSLWPLREAWQQVDSGAHVNHFLSQAAIQHAFSGSLICYFETQTIRRCFQDVNSLVRDLKKVGANYVENRSTGMTGKQRWLRFIQEYEHFRLPNGLLPLDYQVVYVIFKCGEDDAELIDFPLDHC